MPARRRESEWRPARSRRSPGTADRRRSFRPRVTPGGGVLAAVEIGSWEPDYSPNPNCRREYTFLTRRPGEVAAEVVRDEVAELELERESAARVVAAPEHGLVERHVVL